MASYSPVSFLMITDGSKPSEPLPETSLTRVPAGNGEPEGMTPRCMGSNPASDVSSRYSAPAAKPIGPPGNSNHSALSPTNEAENTVWSRVNSDIEVYVTQSAISWVTPGLPAQRFRGTQSPLPGVKEKYPSSQLGMPNGVFRAGAVGSTSARQAGWPVAGSVTASSPANKRSMMTRPVCVVSQS